MHPIIMQSVKTFKANKSGRDFVIGDLHGCFDVLENLLNNLSFDPLKDRMFSVGDLVDRGPDSLSCLDLVHQPWFHAVKANHEQMMLEAFYGGYLGNFWIRNGGRWGYDFLQNFQEHKADIKLEVGARQLTAETKNFLKSLEIIKEFPYLITVNLKSGKKIHIIHAEMPPGQNITDKDLEDHNKVLQLATVSSEDGDFFAWGRHKFYQFCRIDLSNKDKIVRTVKYNKSSYVDNDDLSHIISGHTIVQRPLTILGQTNIDTAAFDSYPNAYGSSGSWQGLTCLELDSWTFYKATASTFSTVEPVVVNNNDIVETEG